MSRPDQPMRIARWPEFEDFKAGCNVAVVSGRSASRLARKKLEFVCIAENVMTGARWLEAWHGQQLETFRVGDLKVVGKPVDIAS